MVTELGIRVRPKPRKVKAEERREREKPKEVLPIEMVGDPDAAIKRKHQRNRKLYIGDPMRTVTRQQAEAEMKEEEVEEDEEHDDEGAGLAQKRQRLGQSSRRAVAPPKYLQQYYFSDIHQTARPRLKELPKAPVPVPVPTKLHKTSKSPSKDRASGVKDSEKQEPEEGSGGCVAAAAEDEAIMEDQTSAAEGTGMLLSGRGTRKRKRKGNLHHRVGRRPTGLQMEMDPQPEKPIPQNESPEPDFSVAARKVKKGGVR